MNEKSLANLKPFQKGKSGCPGGRRRSASITAAVKRLLTRSEAEAIAGIWIKEAKLGSFPHLREILLRIDGPVSLHLDVEGIPAPVEFKPVRGIDFTALARLDEAMASRLSQGDMEKFLSAGSSESPGATE